MRWRHMCIDQQYHQDHCPHTQQKKEEWNEDELGVSFADSDQVIALKNVRIRFPQLYNRHNNHITVY